MSNDLHEDLELKEVWQRQKTEEFLSGQASKFEAKQAVFSAECSGGT